MPQTHFKHFAYSDDSDHRALGVRDVLEKRMSASAADVAVLNECLKLLVATLRRHMQVLRTSLGKLILSRSAEDEHMPRHSDFCHWQVLAMKSAVILLDGLLSGGAGSRPEEFQRCS